MSITATRTTIDVFYGLCEGRHELPNVNGYIYTQVNDVTCVKSIEGIANGFAKMHANKGWTINIYVTGLTILVTSIIKACYKYNVPLVLWHYDRDIDDYYKQVILWLDK